jgi:hypothetical protein
LWFLGLFLLGPFVVILSFPFIFAYAVFKTISDHCNYNAFFIFLIAIVPAVIAFALGIVAGVIAIPYFLLILMPTYIYKEIKNKKETKRAAKEHLKQKFEEAQKIQLKIN